MNKPYPLYDARPEFFDLRLLLSASAEDFGERTAVSYRETPGSDEKTSVTYVELLRDIRALGTELLARGIKGRHVALIGRLSYQWMLTYFAVISVGGVLVPLDPEWSASDLAHTVGKSHAEYLICDNEQLEKSLVISRDAGISGVIYTKQGLGESVNDLVSLGRARINSGDTSFDTCETDPCAMSLLVFTSGTTGQGKGVMLSQRNILSNVYGAQQVATMGEKTVGVLPPHHTFGSTIGVIGPIYVGSKLYISNGLGHFARELRQEKPDCLILVPLFLESFASKVLGSVKKKGKEKIFGRMLKASDALRRVGINMTDRLFAEVLTAFGGNLKQVVCGGAPMGREAYQLFTSLGIRVLNGYGITECSPLISVNRPKHILPESAGMPIPSISVRIDSCGDGDEGEICVKGPNVMLGYFENPSATAEVIDEDGYFHTGDIGRIDPETGYIFITGRIKNLIILANGKNVYPEEIEHELSSIPGISEVVVYEGKSKRGIAHDQIVAEVFMDADFTRANGITDVKAYLDPYIENYNRGAVTYKRVRIVRIRSAEFPKNTLRKIIRFKIDKTIE